MIKIKMYEVDSCPLKVLTNPKTNDIGYTSKGDCFTLFKDEDGVSRWEQLHMSELLAPYYLEDLVNEDPDNVDAIKLFWTLSKNRREGNGIEFEYTD